ncbi:MAG: transposase [Candidatus Thiosymbion ectosymbiont of Robbea hypermnestra]|nr:transposase [Candidatus Thiosymbion ectosymbiont of Robbea hypermnestra]
MLVFCYLGDAKTFSLESIRRSMMGHLNKSISRGAFWERMSGNRLKRNLQDVITELMGRLATSVRVNETILKPLGVTAIELIDSSSITLLAGAKNVFPGTRTEASIKWPASFDLLNGLLVWFQLTPGNRHDRKCFPEFASLTGKLVIFDLGYWDYALLYAIEKAGGFFLIAGEIHGRDSDQRSHSRTR